LTLRLTILAIANSVTLFSPAISASKPFGVFEADSGNRESNRLRLEVGRFLDTVRAA